MMGQKRRNCTTLTHVSLDDLVPSDHFYRHLDKVLDLFFVREMTQEKYGQGGRPSIDPIVFFKLQLVMFFEGIRSERLLMRHAADRLSVRWYMGYDLHEPLPDHSSLTRIRTRYGVEIFRRFFEAIVEQCQQARLVWGREVYADATKVQANASLESLKPRFAVEEHLKTLFASEMPSEASEAPCAQSLAPPHELTGKLALPRLLHPDIASPLFVELTQQNSHRHDWFERNGAPDRQIIRGTYQRQADFQRSRTDPDATVMPLKNGSHLGYQTHYVVDGGKSRIILAALVTPSEVMENQPLLDLLWRTRFRWKLHPRQFTGDTTYGTAENIVALEEQHIRAYVPLPDFDQRTEFFGQRDFLYDAERDVYICPNGAQLHYAASSSTEDYRRYWAKAKECNTCPLKAQCTTSSRGRRLSRPIDEEYLERVRAYHQTEAYKKAIRKRSVWVEPLLKSTVLGVIFSSHRQSAQSEHRLCRIG
jgi:transposase